MEPSIVTALLIGLLVRHDQQVTDDDIRRDIAFSLRSHIRSKRPGDADEARWMAAADVLRHLRLCGYEINKAEKPADLPSTP